MRYKLRPYRWDAAPQDAVALFDVLAVGDWMIEDGVAAPSWHAPALLLAQPAALGGVAITLRSSTAFRLTIAPTMMGWLMAQAGTLEPLADVALHELIGNAVLHGNLEIASGPSGDVRDLDARYELVCAALDDPPRAGRCVTVAAGWTDAELRLCVADEGVGYGATRGGLVGGRLAGGGLASGRELAIVRKIADSVVVLRDGAATRVGFRRDAGEPGT